MAEADTLYGRLLVQQPGNGHHAGAALPAQLPEPDGIQYMLVYVLQQRDLERFMKYYPLGKYAGYDHIPRSYQEALVYVWTQTHKNFQGMPWSISPQVVRDVTEFARIYTSQQNARQMLEARFGSTYWNYLLLRK